MDRFEIKVRFEHIGDEGTTYYVEAENFMEAYEAVKKKSVAIATVLIESGALKFQLDEFRLLKTPEDLAKGSGAVITFTGGDVEAVSDKTPVYEMGSSDAVFFIPGATDCRISVDGEKVSAVQAISIDGDEGELLFIGHPGSDWIKDLPDKKCRLAVEVASEFGKKEIAYDEDVIFFKPKWAISIDDIVTEVTIPFCKYGVWPKGI